MKVRRTLSVFESPSLGLDLVLLDISPSHVMNGSGRVDLQVHKKIRSTLIFQSYRQGPTHLGFQLARQKGRLHALQDVEIIVGGMSPRMSLGPDSRTEDDQVPERQRCIILPSASHALQDLASSAENSLGDGSVYNVHAPHSPSSVIPDPLVPVEEIRLDLRVRVSDLDPFKQVGEEDGRVQALDGQVLEGGLRGEGFLDDGVQALRGKVIKSGLPSRNEHDRQHRLCLGPVLRVRPGPGTHPDLVQPQSQCGKHRDKDPDSR